MLGLWNEAEPWGETEGLGAGAGHRLGPSTALGRLEDRQTPGRTLEGFVCAQPGD